MIGVNNKVYQDDNYVQGNGISLYENANENVVKLNLDLPSNAISVTWENINVHVPAKTGCCGKNQSERMHIVQNVSGLANPGKLLAIMGASGAGKTTLLNILTFRNRGNLDISGEVKVNGQLITSPLQLSAISGYVQQDDLFIGTLTVKEHLKFQAMLRMDKSTKSAVRMERVEEILNDLNLKKCENIVIGVPAKNIKGISGGEKRRLGFATEIITNPGILFCDEPTSGLDSYMALSVVESMKKLAEQGKTIICTIHQPSSEIFEKFDSLCLLAEGRLAYLGDLVKANEFFSSQNLNCPLKYNPADFYIQKLAIVPTDRENCKKNVNMICDGFEKSVYNNELKKEIEKINSIAISDTAIDTKLNVKSPYKENVFTQVRWLIWRNTLATARDPMASRIQVFQAILVAVIFGLIFLRQKLDQEGIQNISGVLFLCITNASFSNLFNIINSFPPEIPIFLREHYNGMYRVASYYFSKVLVELPGLILLPFLFTTIVYWMANLNNGVDRFFICCGTVVLVAITAASFGNLISAAAPSTNVAMGLSAPLLVPLMIFGGFFLNNDTVPDYFIWVKYLSWIGYANEILSVNQWKGITNIECKNSTDTPIIPTNGTTDPCVRTGEQVLTILNMKESKVALDFALMGVLLVAFRILAFLFLLRRSYRNK